MDTSRSDWAALAEQKATLELRVAELERQAATNSELAERNAVLEDRLTRLEALLLEDRKVAEGSQ